MDPALESTASVWRESAQAPSFSSLSQDLRCEVCVVGAGISGLTTAYLLAAEGRSVIVLDDGEVGGGQTGLTSAHLSNALDDRYSYLQAKHGKDGARFAAQSHTTAIDWIERTVQREGIACEFQR